MPPYDRNSLPILEDHIRTAFTAPFLQNKELHKAGYLLCEEIEHRNPNVATLIARTLDKFDISKLKHDATVTDLHLLAIPLTIYEALAMQAKELHSTLPLVSPDTLRVYLDIPTDKDDEHRNRRKRAILEENKGIIRMYDDLKTVLARQLPRNKALGLIQHIYGILAHQSESNAMHRTFTVRHK